MTEAKKQVPSEEADKRQLELAREEGKAYNKSLEYMVTEVAHTGAKKQVEDYIVAIAQEEAEGMYRPDGEGGLKWQEPDEENCHIEVSVSDAADHRFIPGLEIEVTLTAEDGAKIGPLTTPFLWHPGLYHYGANVKVPDAGKYDVTVNIAAPSFARHDETNGKRYAKPVEVVFEGVDIKTGQG
ncbi:iron transporter [Rhizobium sp. L1K21]|uniref:iron transporter n=1 Tax=Rhizobium sp. L1K21 TaxID=2954933 RepID=UPI00209288BB|nr:iron transporter [Rhizobium sp. L1K21]MCO6187852.1 iron transporter [Rhizobium sp. L1K21]